METPKTLSSISLARASTRVHRTTPYWNTPQQRRIADPKTPVRMTDTPGEIPGLINKTWQIFYLSPLFNFSSEQQKLKQYGRSFAVYLQQKAGKEITEGNGESHQCTFSICEGLSVSTTDPTAVQIMVTKQAKNGKTKGDPVVLTAFLCSVDLQLNPCADVKKHFVYYAVLMVRARVALTDILKSWLECHFDCHISPLIPTSVDLAWMVAMWSGMLKETKNKPVELTYTVPEECEGLSRIVYTIDAADCKTLWDSIRSTDREEFTGEEVGAFIKSLEEHFYECFRVKLWKMQLTRIGTAVAYIGDGRMKIFSANDAWRVLRLLSELALEQFQLLASS